MSAIDDTVDYYIGLLRDVESERDALRAENARLRNLLREIIDGATFDNYAYYTVEIDLDGYNAVREALGDE